MIPRCGKKKALVAIEHKIIVASYHILNNNEVYREPTLKTKPDKIKKKSIRNYLNKIQELGMSKDELIQLFESQVTKDRDPFFTET
jgi:adenine-specific DNA methylase